MVINALGQAIFLSGHFKDKACVFAELDFVFENKNRALKDNFEKLACGEGKRVGLVLHGFAGKLESFSGATGATLATLCDGRAVTSRWGYSRLEQACTVRASVKEK